MICCSGGNRCAVVRIAVNVAVLVPVAEHLVVPVPVPLLHVVAVRVRRVLVRAPHAAVWVFKVISSLVVWRANAQHRSVWLVWGGAMRAQKGMHWCGHVHSCKAPHYLLHVGWMRRHHPHAMSTCRTMKASMLITTQEWHMRIKGLVKPCSC
jgi:hypothetical protein